MPTLDFKGKHHIYAHHLSVPYRPLEPANIAISWNGRGSYFDNIFIERLWRSVKYEEVYPNDYDSMNTAQRRLRDYFNFYNRERFHQSLDYRTPYEVYFHSLQALKTDQN